MIKNLNLDFYESFKAEDRFKDIMLSKAAIYIYPKCGIFKGS